MYDPSFSLSALETLVRRSDHIYHKQLQNPSHVLQALIDAQTFAGQLLAGPNLLRTFQFKGKSHFVFQTYEGELVHRKLCANLRAALPEQTSNRSLIINNIFLFLSEGVPFTVYRLDISAYYESFSTRALDTFVESVPNVTSHTRLLLLEVLKRHRALGGTGLPRGLALSALLADRIMSPFDTLMRSLEHVFYYDRFVDDIIVITSGLEIEQTFRAFVSGALPDGLRLNPVKFNIARAPDKMGLKLAAITPICSLTYLGYSLRVSDPAGCTHPSDTARQVDVYIAPSKIKKIKTYIMSAFIDYTKSHDFDLLLDRVRYLTSHVSLIDLDTGRLKTAGIFNSYPCLELSASTMKSLSELDAFLRLAIRANTGRPFSIISPLLTSAMKRRLLGLTFTAGYSSRRFFRFTMPRIGLIRKCWKYA